MRLTFEAAKSDDVDTVNGLVREAVAWLAVMGSDQWQPGALDRRWTDRDAERSLVAGIERGEVALALDGGVVVGTVTVDDFADPQFWTPEDRPETALYLHRMVVARSAAGKGIGTVMLDWAADLAGARGLAWLRLDAWRSNVRLHEYYRRQGFIHVRTVHLARRGSGALFQRPS